MLYQWLEKDSGNWQRKSSSAVLWTMSMFRPKWLRVPNKILNPGRATLKTPAAEAAPSRKRQYPVKKHQALRPLRHEGFVDNFQVGSGFGWLKISLDLTNFWEQPSLHQASGLGIGLERWFSSRCSVCLMWTFKRNIRPTFNVDWEDEGRRWSQQSAMTHASRVTSPLHCPALQPALRSPPQTHLK